jgi:16S rRNA (guanine527-N7)-methyltransferase
LRRDALSPAAIRDAASELGLALTVAQTEKLACFAALLLRWNAAYNLTSIDQPQQVLTHHLLDCLAVVPTLLRASPSPATRVLDVGSGGGLPGIPLAIAMPTWHFTLIDKVGKKTAFLTQAKVELELGNVDVVHGRVQTLRSAAFDVILSRAFSSLGEFVRLSRAARAPRGIWVAMRGAEPIETAGALPPGVTIAEVVKLRVPRLDAERHLVVLRADSDPLPAPA